MDIIEKIRKEVGTAGAGSYPFPAVKIMRMETIWSVEPETRRCFLFLSPENGRAVLDVFVWDQALPDHYHRFHISPHSDLYDYEKKLLEEYCQYDNIKIEKNEIKEVIWRYRYDFPDIEMWEKGNPL